MRSACLGYIHRDNPSAFTSAYEPEPERHFLSLLGPAPSLPNFPSPSFALCDTTGDCCWAGGASFIGGCGGPGRRTILLWVFDSAPAPPPVFLSSGNKNPSSKLLCVLCALLALSCTLLNLSNNSTHLIPSSRPLSRFGLSYVEDVALAGTLFLGV